ncbi:hypothetical protein FIV42_15355 [Persicimonas caeni]|uniref:ApeA N-terminal domain-containing protein n=2 Tax=Persicimonas caeni TaxID=2292766 RepID=A0A4Y6PVC7_PERCE|nr:hypothetical protein [Persicimonas caeni]QDG52069.1 hypothetical protein FIV42_15355 [Persicimonas caeni]
MPDEWKWEKLPSEICRPEFESPCDFFEIERRSDFSLWACGTSYDPPPRDDEEEDGKSRVPGQRIEGETLEFKELSECAVTCYNSLRLDKERQSSCGEPNQVTEKWRCAALERVLRDDEPVHAIDWVLNLRHELIFPRATDADTDVSHKRRREGIEWERMRSRNQDGLDHLSLSLVVNESEYEVNVGCTTGGPQKWLPGFVEYAGAVPSAEERRLIRQSLSFALGGELILVSTSWFNDDGWLIKTRHVSQTFTKVIGAVSGGTAPMTNIAGSGSWLDGNLFDEEKIRQLTQKLIDADELLCVDELKRFYFLARRTVMDVGPAVYGSSFEYIRDRIEHDLPTTLIEKKAYRETVRPALEAAVKGLVDDEFLCPGATVEDLLSKLSYFHKISLTAQSRVLMEHLGLEFGDVEKAALSERNHPAHGRTYQDEHYDTLMRHVRAFQSLINRVILAVTEGADTYIDYSTDGFPERSLEEPLGGPKGDGKPAVFAES